MAKKKNEMTVGIYPVKFTYMVGDNPYQVEIKPAMSEKELQTFSLTLDAIANMILEKGSSPVVCNYFEYNEETKLLDPKKICLAQVVSFIASIPSFVAPSQEAEESDKHTEEEFKKKVSESNVEPEEMNISEPPIDIAALVSENE